MPSPQPPSRRLMKQEAEAGAWSESKSGRGRPGDSRDKREGESPRPGGACHERTAHTDVHTRHRVITPLHRVHRTRSQTGGAEMQKGLIGLLECFNRKERFFLVGNALGNSSFRLSADFRERLGKALRLEEKIPECAFAAMDYHLDWVAAALEAYGHDDEELVFPSRERDGRRLVEGTQEDVDFLIVFKGKDENHHLIFIEAKAYTPWDGRQMRSKVARMKAIFGDDGNRHTGIKPHFCLLSRKPPQRLDHSD